MAKREVYSCDVCGNDNDHPATQLSPVNIAIGDASLGSADAYLEIHKSDVCIACRKLIIAKLQGLNS